MRSAPLLFALLLVACEAKDQGSGSAKAAPAADEAAAKADTKPSADTPTPNAVTIDHTVKLLDGGDKDLRDYRGKALLVVNTASECGHTPQYAGLQEVYAKYKDQGLEVLAFPSNDFGAQEPGTPEQIRQFVDREFSVEFTMFDKVVIKGEDKAPLYRTLTEQTADGIKGEVEWNFTKFLVDAQGRVVQRFDPQTEPTDPAVIEAIERVLPKS